MTCGGMDHHGQNQLGIDGPLRRPLVVVTSVEEERQMMVVCSTMAENNKRLLARFGDLWFRDLSGGRASISPPSDIYTVGRSDRQILIPLHLRNELGWLDGHQQYGTVSAESEYCFNID